MTTALVVFALVTALFGTCAVVVDGGVATISLVLALMALLMTVDAVLQHRPDTLTIGDEGLSVVEIERTALVRKSPARWLASRRIEVAWDEVLAIERARFELDGPAVAIDLSNAATARIGASRLTLPSVDDEISIDQLITELKSRRRAALKRLGVVVRA